MKASLPSTASHWLPNVERRGLGNLVLSINHIALIVSDVGRSTAFYTEVLGLQQIHRPNFDRHGAWLTAGNVEIHLIKGVPQAPDGQNLIVPHIAMDVADEAAAFQKLREMQVNFEVNVSVPKGVGKAESEGGHRSNTLSQAFIRDPDGHYIEICNCHLLTDFALGNCTGQAKNADEIKRQSNSTSQKGTLSASFLFCMAKIAQLANRAKERCIARKKFGLCLPKLSNEYSQVSVGTTSDDHPVSVDDTVLSNLIARTAVYGDICQSFNDDELRAILLEAKNFAPLAILLMLDKVYKGHKRLLFRPPAYYIEGCAVSSHKKSKERRFCPEPIEVYKRRRFSGSFGMWNFDEQHAPQALGEHDDLLNCVPARGA